MARVYQQICPVARTLDIIGERWTMIILRDLFLGRAKFSEFQQDSPTMPARVLSDRLKMLEQRGFIERVVYSEHPLRAEYRLTALGWTLEPVMKSLFLWGIDHTLDARQRAKVLEHLYGTPQPRALRFPPPRRAVRPARAATR
jgi:DNA-binding HxlR family transcriptional regulator